MATMRGKHGVSPDETKNSRTGKESFRKEALNLPNSLTFFRIACIPLVLLFLKISGKTGSFLAALLLALAFITDMLDGYLARRYASVTTLGKFLDPLADKILVSVSMIMLIPLGRIPVWMVIVIIAREMAVKGLVGKVQDCFSEYLPRGTLPPLYVSPYQLSPGGDDFSLGRPGPNPVVRMGLFQPVQPEGIHKE